MESGLGVRAASGYDSAEEGGRKSSRQRRSPPATSRLLNEADSKFEFVLKAEHGWLLEPIATDGNCLFRAVALQVYGDDDMHDVVRAAAMDHIAAAREHFSAFLNTEEENFDAYLARKRKEGVFGNNVEIQAMAELYNRPIEIYVPPQVMPLNIFHRGYDRGENPPIRLSYHHGNHYNAIVNPAVPSVGIGLGLPGYRPGEADAQALSKALVASEQAQLEQELVSGTVYATEVDATQADLEAAIMALSRKEYYDSLVSKGKGSAT